MKRPIVLGLICAAMFAPASANIIVRPNPFFQNQIITKQQAEMDAVQAVGGGTATEARLDDFHDIRVWEVKVVQRRFDFNVDVNAHNGRILRIQRNGH